MLYVGFNILDGNDKIKITYIKMLVKKFFHY